MKLTIEKFQQLNNVAMSDLDDVDKAIEFVRIFTGKSNEQIEKMKVPAFNKICNKVMKGFEASMEKINNDKPSNWMWVGRKLYFINYNIAEISANKYVDIIMFSHNLVDNLHKIMASMVYETKLTFKGIKVLPYDSTRHEEVSKVMLKGDFKHCYHLALFFYQLLRHSTIALKPYMAQEATHKEKVEKALTDFIEIMDGLPMPKWCQNLKISV